ncbi:hypothetical protein A6R68_22013, partial [Neotoma lepida]
MLQNCSRLTDHPDLLTCAPRTKDLEGERRQELRIQKSKSLLCAQAPTVPGAVRRGSIPRLVFFLIDPSRGKGSAAYAEVRRPLPSEDCARHRDPGKERQQLASAGRARGTLSGWGTRGDLIQGTCGQAGQA